MLTIVLWDSCDEATVFFGASSHRLFLELDIPTALGLHSAIVAATVAVPTISFFLLLHSSLTVLFIFFRQEHCHFPQNYNRAIIMLTLRLQGHYFGISTSSVRIICMRISDSKNMKSSGIAHNFRSISRQTFFM